jgi:ABC-type Fe3+ transport system substrate-binding protein
MLKRALIAVALVVIVAVPFILRPHQPSAGQADDTLVLISPHNEAIRDAFSYGFRDWYKARTGRTVFLDWRNIGGTSDIARYLESQYVASFQLKWLAVPGHAWSAEIQSGFQSGRLAPDAPAVVREARTAFLASDAGCGIDLFFGGGPSDFADQAAAGRLVDSGLLALHPDWFTDESFPRVFGGEENWDRHGLWFGSVLSSYGILFNRDSLKRLGYDHEPEQWSDLCDPRFLGEVGLCDPTKSGSIAQAFQNVIQQQIHRRLAELGKAEPSADAKAMTARAVRLGWIDGLRLIQLAGANARYFTDTSQKPPIDVANGNCAAGMCIDFYGREEQEAVLRRGGGDRVGYVSPEGGSAYSVDPIALLRGAPHRAVAVAFMEFVLSLDGQKLWAFKTGAPGGPRQYALRRLPVRRDFYAHAEWKQYRTDPDVNPYTEKTVLIFHPEWTISLFRELEYIVRWMCEDTHPELVRAWKAVIAAPEPAKTRALAALQDVSAVDFDQGLGRIKKGISSRNQAEAIELGRDIDGGFRANYARAERIARGQE